MMDKTKVECSGIGHNSKVVSDRLAAQPPSNQKPRLKFEFLVWNNVVMWLGWLCHVIRLIVQIFSINPISSKTRMYFFKF